MSGRQPFGIGGNDGYANGQQLVASNSFHTQLFRVVCNADVCDARADRVSARLRFQSLYRKPANIWRGVRILHGGTEVCVKDAGADRRS